MKRLWLTAVVAAAALPARASLGPGSTQRQSAPDRAESREEGGVCRPLSGLGCFRAEGRGSATLLIYLRGHLTRPLPGKRSIAHKYELPQEQLALSARDAVDQYDLDRAAYMYHADLVVTGASPVAVTPEALAARGIDVSRYQRVILAAHSGGYVGLHKSLPRWPHVDGVVMLDDFYGARSGTLRQIGLEVARRMRREGTTCGGFFTQHNAWRLRHIFQRALAESGQSCVVAQAARHNSGIAEKLVAALEQAPSRQQAAVEKRVGRLSALPDTIRFDGR